MKIFILLLFISASALGQSRTCFNDTIFNPPHLMFVTKTFYPSGLFSFLKPRVEILRFIDNGTGWQMVQTDLYRINERHMNNLTIFGGGIAIGFGVTIFFLK